MTPTRQLPILALVLALFTPGAPADFNDGVVALMTGDYDAALTTFVPLAEASDHAYAQYFLARMYAAGQGVDQDLQTAAAWYRKAAEKGVGDAQYRLGALYERGEGVPGDMEYAYGWYSVAAHVGNAKGAEALAKARDKLSAAELVEAKKLSRDLIEKYGVVPKSTSRSQ
jgi:uncharacterized protein